MHKLSTRTFVSAYVGRICVGVLMLNKFPKRGGKWEIANAVVDPRARKMGLGKHLATLSMQLAFREGCKELILGAELLESQHPETGKKIFQKKKDSGAYLFWRHKMGFKQMPMQDYHHIHGEKLVGVVPMKMTPRMRAAREAPQMDDIILHLLPLLKNVSRKIDGKT